MYIDSIVIPLLIQTTAVSNPQMLGCQQQQGQLTIMMTLIDGPNLHDIIFGGKHQVMYMHV